MSLTTAHIISLVLTLTAVIMVGIYAASRVKTAADFTVGGKKSGASLVAGTILGTIVGGSSTVGTAQLAFSVGLSAWWFTLGAGLALMVLALGYAKPLRISGLETIPQFLVYSYGRAAGPLASLTSSAGIFFAMVANTLAAVPLVAAIFHITLLQATGVVLLLTVLYVCCGGVWGTGLVGILKTFLIYVMLLTVGWITYHDMHGLPGFRVAFPAHPWFDLFGRGVATDLGAGLSLIVGTLSTQTYIQAVYAARNVATARIGALMAALLALPAGVPSIMVGLFMRVHHPDILPIDALPLFIVQYLPPWLGGVALAALLLAAVGSSAGLALGVGTMLTRDVCHPLLVRIGNRDLWFNRLAVLVITTAAALFAAGNLHSLVLTWNYLSMGLRGAGIFLPFTAAVFWPGRIAPRWAVWSMAAGTITALLWKAFGPQGIDPLFAGLAAGGIILVGGLHPLAIKGAKVLYRRAGEKM